MYYFIPAWYGSNRQWHADVTPWYYSSLDLNLMILSIKLGFSKTRDSISTISISLSTTFTLFFT